MDDQEVNAKIKSAMKAKLVELGAYVDDELPEYIMVMVANKKTFKQMDQDLEIFLHQHTKVFTKWLFSVLEKLKRVSKVKKSKDGKDKPEKKEGKKKIKKVTTGEVGLEVEDDKKKKEKMKKKKVKVKKPANDSVVESNDNLEPQPEATAASSGDQLTVETLAKDPGKLKKKVVKKSTEDGEKASAGIKKSKVVKESKASKAESKDKAIEDESSSDSDAEKIRKIKEANIKRKTSPLKDVGNSKKNRSRSPGLRSRSPGLRSRSPGLRSRSPGLRSRSPGLRSRSPGLKSRSPRLRSRSPKVRSRSPVGRRLEGRGYPVSRGAGGAFRSRGRSPFGSPPRQRGRRPSPMGYNARRKIDSDRRFGHHRSQSPDRHAVSRRSPHRRLSNDRRRHSLDRIDDRRNSVENKRRRERLPSDDEKEERNVKIRSTVGAVVNHDSDGEYNPMKMLKTSISSKITVPRPTDRLKRNNTSKKPLRPDGGKSLILKAVKEADSSIKKMSELEKERSAILKDVGDRTTDRGVKPRPSLISKNLSLSERRQVRRVSVSEEEIDLEKETDSPRKNFVIEIKNRNANVSKSKEDLRSRLDKRRLVHDPPAQQPQPYDPVEENEKVIMKRKKLGTNRDDGHDINRDDARPVHHRHQDSNRDEARPVHHRQESNRDEARPVNYRHESSLSPRTTEEDQALKEMRRRALESLARSRPPGEMIKVIVPISQMSSSSDSSSNSDSSDSDSSDDSDSDGSSSDPSEAVLPVVETKTKKGPEPTFIVTLDGVDSSYFKNKKPSQTGSQLNLLKARYKDQDPSSQTDSCLTVVVEQPKKISVPVLKAVGGGSGGQDPKTLEAVYQITKKPEAKVAPLRPTTVPTSTIATSPTVTFVKQEKFDTIGRRDHAEKNTPVKTDSQKPVHVKIEMSRNGGSTRDSKKPISINRSDVISKESPGKKHQPASQLSPPKRASPNKIVYKRSTTSVDALKPKRPRIEPPPKELTKPVQKRQKIVF